MRRLHHLVSAAVCATAIAACGGATASGYRNPKYPYGAPNVPISLSKCMRANGVSGFPDPREGPNGGGVGWPGGLGTEIGGTAIFVFGHTYAGPAVAHAEQVCKEYLPPSGPPPALSESQRQQALAHAHCMRTDGVPSFPDPAFSGGAQELPLPPGLNPESPAMQRAIKACGLGNQ
jgi:hypothetical protein